MKLFHYPLAISLLLVLGCAQNQAQNAVEVIDKATFVQLIEEQNPLTILDVRTADEVAQGNVPGSINIDWFDQENFKGSIENLDKSTPVVVYCMSGKRSAQAAALLHASGFETVYDFSAGFSGWE